MDIFKFKRQKLEFRLKRELANLNSGGGQQQPVVRFISLVQDGFRFVLSLQVPSRTTHRQNCEADQGYYFSPVNGWVNELSIHCCPISLSG